MKKKQVKKEKRKAYSSLSMFVNPSKASAMGSTLWAVVDSSTAEALLSLQHNDAHKSRENHFWMFEKIRLWCDSSWAGKSEFQ